MSLKEVFAKKLTPEMLAQINDALGDDFDYDMVPRTRLNKVIKQRNDLKALIEGETGQKLETSEGDPVDGDEGIKSTDKAIVEKQIQALKEEMEAAHAKAMQEMKVQYAALDKLRAANALDADLILKSGALDMTKVAFDEVGAISGLDEQIASLTKDKAFLFKAAEAPKGTGKESGATSSPVDDKIKNVFANYGITPIEKG